MKVVAAILVLAMVLKDASYLGDRYFMRGFAQGLCLLAGSYWLITNFTIDVIKKHWMLLLFLFYLLVISTLSYDSNVIFQSVSLLAIIVFFIAFSESTNDNDKRQFMLFIVFLYFLVSLASIAVLQFYPEIAFEPRTMWSNETRFRGVMSEPGMLGAMVGIGIGIALFVIKRIWIKLIVLAPMLVCLALSGSRTFWIALVVSALVTGWKYYPGFRKTMPYLLSAVIVGIILISAVGISIDSDHIAKIARIDDTLFTLTGRTGIWAAAFEAIGFSPLTGFGLTYGSNGLFNLGLKLFEYIPNAEGLANIQSHTFSLHSGYVQMMMDIGIIGVVIYLLIIFSAIFSVVRKEAHKENAIIMFGLIYFSIANVTESIIYSAAVFHSIFAWFLIVNSKQQSEPIDTSNAK